MQENMSLLPGLKATVKSLPINSITTPRRSTLHKLINYIQEKLTKGEAIKLNFICTHNSRRSQFAQIWAQTAANYYGIPVTCYSGGVEVTALQFLMRILKIMTIHRKTPENMMKGPHK